MRLDIMKGLHKVAYINNTFAQEKKIFFLAASLKPDTLR